MVTEEEPYIPPAPTLEEAKAAKLAEINTAADRATLKEVEAFAVVITMSGEGRAHDIHRRWAHRP